MIKNRDVKSCSLKGLNFIDSIYNVEDGWCQKAHNISFRDGSCKGVSQHKKEIELNVNEFLIKYIHPILPQNEYIAMFGMNVCHIKDEDGSLKLIKNIISLQFGTDLEDVSFNSFADILYINYKLYGKINRDAFIYQNKQYIPQTIDKIYEIPSPEIAINYYHTPKDSTKDKAMRVATITIAKIQDTDQDYIVSFDKKYETIYANITTANYIYGSIYLMFAVKMRDGSIISNSKVFMLNSEPGSAKLSRTLHKVVKGQSKNTISFYKDIFGFQPTIKFSGLDYLKDNEEVESIIIYSTRNTPIHNFDNIYYDFPTSPDDYDYVYHPTGFLYSAQSHFVFDKRNFNIAGSPFYMIDEIDLRTTDNITLTADSYSDIEKKPIYTPMVAPHKYVSEKFFNLNGRLHQYNISAQLYPCASPLISEERIIIDGSTYVKFKNSSSSNIQDIYVAVTLNIANSTHVVNSKVRGYTYRKLITFNGTSYSAEHYVIIPNMLTYPDVRAVKMDIYYSRVISGVTQYTLIQSNKLKPALANNYAVCSNTVSDAMMYYDVVEHGRLLHGNYTPIVNNDSCKFKNQLMVSELYKPHSFSPQHVYYIGDSVITEIVDANTPTDQLTESRFGEYPLYLFTTTGIYAMEQGTDSVLYRNIVKINNDVVIKGSVTNSAEGKLFYFTDKGFSLLTGSDGSVISSKLDMMAHKFIEEATISYIPFYRELLITNSKYDYAYIFSFNNGGWSTREFSGVILSYDKYLRGSIIYNYLLPEDESLPLIASLTTREISLNSRQQKKLEVLKIDILAEKRFTITLKGSNDGKEWSRLHSSENCDYIRRTNSSWRWYIVEVDGEGFEISNFHFESFIRFSRHIK